MTGTDTAAPDDAVMIPAARTAATLLTASAVGRLPQAMSALAVVQLVVGGGGTYSLAAAATAAFVLAGTLGQPLLGRLVDRTGRPRPVLIGSAVVSAAALLLLAGSVRTAPVVLAAAALAGFMSPPLEPTLRGFWPRLFPEPERLHRAFSADVAVQEVLFIVGPLLTVLAVSTFGAPGAVRLMGLLGLLGTVLFCLHRRPADAWNAARRRRTRGRPSALRIGALRVLVRAQATAGLPIGVLTITATTHADRAGVDAAAGWGLAANAVGALLGAVLVAAFPLRPAPEVMIRRLLLVLAALYLPTAAVGLPTAGWLVCAFVAGLGLPPLLTQVFDVVGRIAPGDVTTEANAWVVSAFSVGIAAGTLLGGVAVEIPASPGTGILVAVVGACALTAAGGLQTRPRRLISEGTTAPRDSGPA
ncbi:MFS transporter [Kineosporia succinea]|uniref:MFS family arabinose efflux permease n=1 Tax=Kineosporia succinea TaxID=84632 RepID=A0ABT9PC46_9ACTN|nr:MFS transporter [Kineosporia succinea]MDP9830057.1 putative MFS family arabinose efflux permease [Kineosporia succinea]